MAEGEGIACSLCGAITFTVDLGDGLPLCLECLGKTPAAWTYRWVWGSA